ncbi:protein JINGUBANG [Andrographis paniculata]|uniref:protein JINGUBANG n=1 Tax=Andrographis paniculata TaxID=175694 RepID=UPI0021E7BB68|nr:protein JINGUBANG [Andrographis paniculata]
MVRLFHSNQLRDSHNFPFPLDPTPNPPSSLSSQSSLQSLPSLSPLPSSQSHQPPPTHHHCLATLRARSYIFSLAIAAKRLYAGDSDGQLRTWDRDPTSCNEHPIAANLSAVKSIAVVGARIFTAHHDHRIRVWRIDSSQQQKHRLVAILPTLGDRCSRLFSAKNYVKVRGHKRCTWVHHVDAVSALAVTADGSLLYSVSWDRTLKVWQTSSFRCLESVQNAHDDAINAVVLSRDGTVYTGSADKKIKVWVRVAGEGKGKHSLIATLERHKSAVNTLALSSDGSTLFSGACDRSIIVWERETNGVGHMAVAGALRGHTQAILCLAIHATAGGGDSDLVCSGSADRTVRIWRRGVMGDYACLGVLEGHASPVKCLALAADSDPDSAHAQAQAQSYLLYSGSLDKEIKVWQVRVPDLLGGLNLK